jgi:hypothetical protein
MGKPKDEVVASYEEYKASSLWSPELDARLEGVSDGIWDAKHMPFSVLPPRPSSREMATADMVSFSETLAGNELAVFQRVRDVQVTDNFPRLLTMAENVTQAAIFNACKHSSDCDRTIDSWQRYSLPDIKTVAAEWMQVEPAAASDATLMDGMRKLATEDAAYWGMDAGFCFGVAKVVDEQLQQFLEDVAPGQRFTSGLFLSGFKSRIMQANDDLAAIASAIKRDRALETLVATTQHTQVRKTPSWPRSRANFSLF